MWLKDFIPFGERQRRDINPTRGSLTTLHGEINSLFDRALARIPGLALGMDGFNIDVVDEDKEIHVKAELPGVSEEDISLRLSDNILIIQGEKKQEKQLENKEYYLMERRYGTFTRSIALPFNVESDKVEAEMDHGVITVRIPKSPEVLQRAKEIKLKKK